MAPQEQNQLPTLEADLPADTPQAEDGGHEEAAPAPRAPQPRDDIEEPAEQEAPQKWEDTKRAEIFGRARERRAAAMQEGKDETTSPFDPGLAYGDDADDQNLGELEREAIERQRNPMGQQQAQQGQKPLSGNDPTILGQRVRRIVDGREEEVTVEELLRTNQINVAADRRLSQAQEILRQAQEIQRQAIPRPGDEDFGTTGQDDSQYRGQGQGTQRGNTSRQVPANASELIDKIQLGNADDAAEALASFITNLQGAPSQGTVDEASRVLMVLEDRNAKDAVQRFAEAHPELQDPDFEQIVANRARREMVNDLSRAGYTEDQIRQAASHPTGLTDLHKYARVNRVKGVRPVDQIISAAHQQAMTWRTGASAPAQQQQNTTLQQRQQRKDTLQSQPVARRLSPTTQSQAPRTESQSRQAGFNALAAGRGQRTK